MTIHIRNYRERDLESLATLINSIESVDRTEDGTTAEELRLEYSRPDFNPTENVFIAEDNNGRIIGYAGLILRHEATEDTIRSSFNIHPVWRGRGLEDRLLQRLIQRAQERLPEATAENVYFHSGGQSVYPERLAAIQRKGMVEVRRFWRMVRKNLATVPAPRFDTQFVVREFRLDEDDEETRTALNDAFRVHWGHSEETPEEWQHFIQSPRFRPDLTVLAIDRARKRIAGFCLVVVNQDECTRLGRKRGWIDVLGVRAEYRQRGLGEALLLQGMVNLREAGMEEAALACDSENTTGATRLYFRTGFEVAREWIVYQMPLREAALDQKLEHELKAA